MARLSCGVYRAERCGVVCVARFLVRDRLRRWLEAIVRRGMRAVCVVVYGGKYGDERMRGYERMS